MLNVICNNCGGADFYKLNKQPYHNPFMWSCIFADDMIELIRVYDELDFENAELIKLTDVIAHSNNYGEYDSRKHICGIRIDDKVNVFYTHYVYDPCQFEVKRIGSDVHYIKNFEYAYNSYMRRVKRMLADTAADTIFVIIAFNRHGWNYEKVNELLQVNARHKVVLITDQCVNYKNSCINIIRDATVNNTNNNLPITYIKRYFNRITL